MSEEVEKIIREDTAWISNDKKTIWMPKREYDQLQKLRESQTIEQLNRESYFFWNNFNMDGYEEYIKNKNNKIKDDKE